MYIHFGQDCLELRLSALATEMRWRGTCFVVRWRCDAGRCTEGLYRVCGKASVTRERKQNTELLSGPRPRPLSAETKHLLKHWTFYQFHLS